MLPCGGSERRTAGGASARGGALTGGAAAAPRVGRNYRRAPRRPPLPPPAPGLHRHHPPPHLAVRGDRHGVAVGVPRHLHPMLNGHRLRRLARGVRVKQPAGGGDKEAWGGGRAPAPAPQAGASPRAATPSNPAPRLDPPLPPPLPWLPPLASPPQVAVRERRELVVALGVPRHTRDCRAAVAEHQVDALGLCARARLDVPRARTRPRRRSRACGQTRSMRGTAPPCGERGARGASTRAPAPSPPCGSTASAARTWWRGELEPGSALSNHSQNQTTVKTSRSRARPWSAQSPRAHCCPLPKALLPPCPPHCGPQDPPRRDPV
jgi:hypothetical protein